MWKFIKRRSAAEAPAQGNPLPQVLDLSSAARVLVVAPHPDDESLGCGGTLARLASSAEVHVLLVTNGDGGGALPPGTSDMRKREMSQATRALGIASEVIHFDEPDGRFQASASFRSRFAALVERLAPNWVFAPWLGDSHSDHALIASDVTAVLALSKVEWLAYYETWTPVPATHVVDITSTLEAKKAAIQCHATALKHGNYLEASLGLSAYRALYLPAGQQRWAEAFAVTDPRRNRFAAGHQAVQLSRVARHA